MTLQERATDMAEQISEDYAVLVTATKRGGDTRMTSTTEQTTIYALTDRNDADRDNPIISLFTTRAAAEAYAAELGYGAVEEMSEQEARPLTLGCAEWNCYALADEWYDSYKLYMQGYDAKDASAYNCAEQDAWNDLRTQFTAFAGGDWEEIEEEVAGIVGDILAGDTSGLLLSGPVYKIND